MTVNLRVLVVACFVAAAVFLWLVFFGAITAHTASPVATSASGVVPARRLRPKR